jgi:hypothetical protein
MESTNTKLQIQPIVKIVDIQIPPANRQAALRIYAGWVLALYLKKKNTKS